jgi:L-ascorbate metabolism protein UlaG (beta-lactamase superfamily)
MLRSLDTTHADLAFAPSDLARGAGADPIEVTWLGTAGFAISHGGHKVLVDPYLSRAPLSTLVTRRLRPDEATLERMSTPGAVLDRFDAIVVGHTHFDHVLDVPWLLRRSGARVYGSTSAALLCRGAGVEEDRIVDVERAMRGEPVVAEVGSMRLRFIPSAHSPLLLGRVPFPGDISDCAELPLRAHQYRCGSVFGVEISVGGVVLYHVGSAELLETTRGPQQVDVAMVCVAGWKSSPSFPERLVRALSPKNVVLSHWDDFLRPIAAPVTPLPALELPRFVDRLMAASREVRIGTLPLLGSLQI